MPPPHLRTPPPPPRERTVPPSLRQQQRMNVAAHIRNAALSRGVPESTVTDVHATGYELMRDITRLEMVEKLAEFILERHITIDPLLASWIEQNGAQLAKNHQRTTEQFGNLCTLLPPLPLTSETNT